MQLVQPIVNRPFIQVVPIMVVVMEVIDISRSMTHNGIEASISWPRAGSKANVPLTETAGGERGRGLFQKLRNQNFTRIQSNTVVPIDSRQLVEQTMPLRNTACQQAGPRDRAGRAGGVELGQPHTLICELVQARGRDL